jgi:gliding motility-associated-like protein
MKLRLLCVVFFICCFKSFGFSLNNLPNDIQIDDSTDYNFFSPNNDSINDFFIIEKIKSGDIREAKFSVFNRWGDLVFEESPYKNRWDGKGNQLNVKEEDLPEGVYIYRLEFKVNEKTTTTLGKIILKR